MALPAGLSLQMKVSIPCFLLGLLLFCISFSVPYWGKGSPSDNVDIHVGMWRACVISDGADACMSWSDDRLKYWSKSKFGI